MEKVYVAYLIGDYYNNHKAVYASKDKTKVINFLKKYVHETYSPEHHNWGYKKIDEEGGIDDDCYYVEYPLDTEF